MTAVANASSWRPSRFRLLCLSRNIVLNTSAWDTTNRRTYTKSSQTCKISWGLKLQVQIPSIRYIMAQGVPYICVCKTHFFGQNRVEIGGASYIRIRFQYFLFDQIFFPKIYFSVIHLVIFVCRASMSFSIFNYC